MRRWLILMSSLCLCSSLAHANCITFDLAAWTSEQRDLFGHVVVTSVNDGVKLRRLREENVEVCALTADLSSLNAATLQSMAQTIVTTHATSLSEAQARRAAALIEMRANTLCTATKAEVVSYLNGIHDDIEEVIDAIDGTNTVGKLKAALKLANDERTAIDKKLAICVLSRATLQGGE